MLLSHSGVRLDADVSLLGESKAKIINFLGEGERTGKDLAEMLDINHTAVREHLEALERMGIVRSRFVKKGVGRPRKIYCLTPFGVELLPKHYDLLLNALLKKLWEKGGDVLLGEMLSEVVKDLSGNEEAQALIPVERRIEKVVGLLNSLGFMAKIEKEGDKLFVVRHNCIFNKTAKLYSDVLCSECDNTLIKGPIGERVELISCIGKGDSSCRNLIKV